MRRTVNQLGCCLCGPTNDVRDFGPPCAYKFRLAAQDHRDAASFKRGEPVVGTTYFYWDDIDTNSDILSPAGEDYLTTHPATSA